MYNLKIVFKVKAILDSYCYTSKENYNLGFANCNLSAYSGKTLKHNKIQTDKLPGVKRKTKLKQKPDCCESKP